MVSVLVCVLVLAHLPFIVLDGFGVGVCAGFGPFIMVLDGVGIGVHGLGPFAVVLDGVGIGIRGLGPFFVVLDWHQSRCWCSCCLGPFVVVLGGVGVGVGVRAGLGAFIVVLDSWSWPVRCCT